MAAYGAELKEGKTAAQALAFVKQLLQHTVSQPDSGSDATAAFIGGTGNVLIGYENEAIAAQQAGDKIDYVTPPDTILIENPVAVTSNASNSTLAKNFVQFLYSDQGQKIFASKGYRPVVKADLDPSKFPTPPGLFTIASLGGWDKVNTEFFDPSNGSITKIEDSLGRGASG
jgi:sulfate transport system substrate-binding protein